MSVNGINPVTVSTVQTVSGRVATSGGRPTVETSEPKLDKSTGQPLPPRFPWLSRITRELERASNQAPTYQPAPLIGENLDKSA